MPSEPFVFPGHTAYLEAAAAGLGRPEFARAAGRQVALTALANLCAQASRADVTHAGAILSKAAEFRDQLAIALQAADAMLADVGVPLDGGVPAAEANPPAEAPRRSTKGRAL